MQSAAAAAEAPQSRGEDSQASADPGKTWDRRMVSFCPTIAGNLARRLISGSPLPSQVSNTCASGLSMAVNARDKATRIDGPRSARFELLEARADAVEGRFENRT